MNLTVDFFCPQLTSVHINHGRPGRRFMQATTSLQNYGSGRFSSSSSHSHAEYEGPIQPSTLKKIELELSQKSEAIFEESEATSPSAKWWRRTPKISREPQHLLAPYPFAENYGFSHKSSTRIDVFGIREPAIGDHCRRRAIRGSAGASSRIMEYTLLS
jgi:hypothetical protein